MGTHPFHDVAIASVFNTRQARRLDGHDSFSLCLEAARGAIACAGVVPDEVDGIFCSQATRLVHTLGIGPAWATDIHTGISGLLEAASLVATGICSTVLVVEGRAGQYTDHQSTAPWTRPDNEFVAPFGLYTAVEFALIARRHMAIYGTTSEQISTVSAVIRNNGHVNPDAVYFGRGPYTLDDILGSRMVADPFHLLDCSMTAEGGCAILITSAQRASDLVSKPVYVLGGGRDVFGPVYQHAPSWDLTGRRGIRNGDVGCRAASRAFATAGLRPSDVDSAELYDPFAFEIIRQLEAFGFCAVGEGGPFVLDGNISPDGALPVTTDGGTMSYCHGGGQLLQRVTRGVQQIRQECPTTQVAGCEVVLCTNGGAGALFTDVVLIGSDRP